MTICIKRDGLRQHWKTCTRHGWASRHSGEGCPGHPAWFGTALPLQAGSPGRTVAAYRGSPGDDDVEKRRSVAHEPGRVDHLAGGQFLRPHDDAFTLVLPLHEQIVDEAWPVLDVVRRVELHAAAHA